MTDTGLILGEPSSYLLFTIFFSLTLSFYLLFPLEDSIIQRRKPKTMNHVQQSSTQESPSIVILGAREWKKKLLAIWQRGFIRCVLCLGWELRELVQEFYR
jgi:hypothetical protein